jgi:uncharacterized protein
MKEWKLAASFVVVFLVAYHLPLSNPKVSGAFVEAFKLLPGHACNHTPACDVPALFIAGGIITFLSQAPVMKSLGSNSDKPLACAVASVASTVLAACSCTEQRVGKVRSYEQFEIA